MRSKRLVELTGLLPTIGPVEDIGKIEDRGAVTLIDLKSLAVVYLSLGVLLGAIELIAAAGQVPDLLLPPERETKESGKEDRQQVLTSRFTSNILNRLRSLFL